MIARARHSLQAATGDSGLLLDPDDPYSLYAEPDRERLNILRLEQGAAGRRVYRCHRVVTGNEYRRWQQTGNVSLDGAGDAGSNPAGDA